MKDYRMLIWTCVESKDKENAKLTEVSDAKYWALIEMNGGETKEITFYDKREDFTDWVDFIIMKNKYESYMDFMNEGMMILCTREQETISEVIESFVFKELDEV
jgi:predicted Fe-Mo cluster-binding NifX family protein